MLKKKNRIISSALFDKILHKGKSKKNEYFKIVFLENNLNYSRYGIIVSSQISKLAVQRNLIKRRIRNALKDLLPVLDVGFDVIIIAQKKSLKLNFLEIKECLRALCFKLRG